MARPASRCSTSWRQSRMGDLGEAAERAEEFRPFGAKRKQHFLTRGREAIAAAAAAICTGFPGAANPAALLHAVQHRVQGGEAEAERAFGLHFNAVGHFVAVQRTVFQYAEDGQFRGALLDASADHRLLPYM